MLPQDLGRIGWTQKQKPGCAREIDDLPTEQPLGWQTPVAVTETKLNSSANAPESRNKDEDNWCY